MKRLDWVHAGHAGYQEGVEVIVSDSAWRPDGTGLVACLFYRRGARTGPKLVRVEVG